MPRTTAFQSVALNLTGPSYMSRSVPVSAQRTVNMYPEANPGGISDFILMPFPGLGLHAAIGAGQPEVATRAVYVMKGVTYQIVGPTLYSLNGIGTRTVISDAIAGTGPVGIADNGTTMLICNGSTPYSYNQSTDTFATETSIGFNPKVVTHLNNQFICDGSDGLFSVADAGTTTFQLANSAAAESDPDRLIAPYAHNQILWLFGEGSVEPWENTGTGSPPFERITGGIIEGIGTSSPHGIASTPHAMYFVDQTGSAYAIRSLQPEVITRPGVVNSFKQYSLDQIVAWSFTFQGQWFAAFQFPEATWCYNENLGDWFELSHEGAASAATDGDNYIGSHYAYNPVTKMHLLGDRRNGQMYRWEFEPGEFGIPIAPGTEGSRAYKNNFETMARERVLHVIAGETFGRPRQVLEMSRLQISLEAGVGLIDDDSTTGTGTNPELIVQPSYDGGKTWGQEYRIKVGRKGEHDTQVCWDNMAQFQRLAIRLRMTDPVKWVLYAASIDLREAGEI